MKGLFGASQVFVLNFLNCRFQLNLHLSNDHLWPVWGFQLNNDVDFLYLLADAAVTAV